MPAGALVWPTYEELGHVMQLGARTYFSAAEILDNDDPRIACAGIRLRAAIVREAIDRDGITDNEHAQALDLGEHLIALAEWLLPHARTHQHRDTCESAVGALHDLGRRFIHLGARAL